MARKPRIHYPGALYHVILRGNDGQSIFFDEKDRTRFSFLLQEGVERFWPSHPRLLFDEQSCPRAVCREYLIKRGRIEGTGQRSPIIGSSRDGGVVDSGTGGKHTWGIGEGDGPRCDDVKFCSKALTDTCKKGLGIGREDEGSVGSSLLNCNNASSDPIPIPPGMEICDCFSFYASSMSS